jgi:hypothetical protein
MSFESRVIAFAERCFSERTLELIVAPAIADLQYEQGAGRLGQAASRLAVLRAVAGGVREDVAPHFGTFLALALMPAFYYAFLLVMFLDFFEVSTDLRSADLWSVAILIGVLSLGPVLACFWPERHTRSVD